MNKITIQKLPNPESGTVRRPTPLLPMSTTIQVPSSAGLKLSPELGVKRTLQDRLRNEIGQDLAQKTKSLSILKSEAVKRTISDIKKFLNCKNNSLFSSGA